MQISKNHRDLSEVWIDDRVIQVYSVESKSLWSGNWGSDGGEDVKSL